LSRIADPVSTFVIGKLEYRLCRDGLQAVPLPVPRFRSAGILPASSSCFSVGPAGSPAGGATISSTTPSNDRHHFLAYVVHSNPTGNSPGSAPRRQPSSPARPGLRSPSQSNESASTSHLRCSLLDPGPCGTDFSLCSVVFYPCAIVAPGGINPARAGNPAPPCGQQHPFCFLCNEHFSSASPSKSTLAGHPISVHGSVDILGTTRVSISRQEGAYGVF
jgi:hypothetical protein